jgi:kynurenine formamidase
MPSWTAAGDPSYNIWMTHTPEGSMLDDLAGVGSGKLEKFSYSGDAITMYTHCGTHLDTLNHFGFFGCYWNGWTSEKYLGSRHWMKGGAEKYPNIIARGVLLDVAGLHGTACLPEGYAITPDELKNAAREQGVELRRGDVVLVRTGQMTKWPDFHAYPTNTPGLGLAATRYLCEEAGAMCIGGDNIALEVIPMEDERDFLPVHCYIRHRRRADHRSREYGGDRGREAVRVRVHRRRAEARGRDRLTVPADRRSAPRLVDQAAGRPGGGGPGGRGCPPSA